MKRERFRINDKMRHEWILNYEGLYNWHHSTGMCIGQFIRENRAEIDRTILWEINRHRCESIA